jgi:uncharacterized membrane protein
VIARVRLVARWLLAAVMVWVGITHFTSPEPFVRIVPAALPAPLLLVWISGVAEIVLGVLLLAPHRIALRLARWGLIALLIAVFPANVNMAWNQIQLTPEGTMPVWAMWARLPFQALFVAWAWWVTRPPAQPSGTVDSSR